MMKRSRWFGPVGVAALVLAAAVSAPAANAAESSARSDVDPRIAAVLAEVPGGVVLDYDDAIWAAQDMRMHTPGAQAKDGIGVLSVGGCATDRVCVFDGYSASGAQISWGSCGTSFGVSSFTVRSIADARSSGYASARAGSTVRASAGAGSWANVSGSVDNVLCVS